MNAHTLKLWGRKPIDTVRTDEIRLLIRETLKNRSPHQQKNVLKFIRGAFNYAVEAGLLMRNPVPKMQFRMGDKIKRVLTLPQAKLLLEKAKEYNHEWYSVWVAALYTGMRNGELHALTWDKVNFDNKTILVSCSWNKKDGIKDLTKSGEDRIIEIAGPLMAVLRELKVQNQDSVFVLPRIQTWDDGRQAEMLRMFLTGINIPHVRFHDLRASWATMLLSQGLEPAKVMRLGGWRDLKTLMIYVRKAGIDTRGSLAGFTIHDPSTKSGDVLTFKSPSCRDL
ncbi:MAG: site-specific integrase [Bdellovibrionales bacterium]|nr:site-specific integrase [Bdellovibrionales bacterium]